MRDTGEARANALRSAEAAIQLTDENENVYRLADMLANLMHWADENYVSFGQALDKGRFYYEGELEGEE